MGDDEGTVDNGVKNHCNQKVQVEELMYEDRSARASPATQVLGPTKKRPERPVSK